MSFLKKLIKKMIREILKVRISFHKTDPVTEKAQRSSVDTDRIFTRPLKHTEEKTDLSLIVPVYNAEKYLKECIDSLAKQKTGYAYEIICVDDGSTDDSFKILEGYKDKVTVISQENGGISAARNTGLEASKGRYVGFVDNDDCVAEDYVEKLMKKAEESDADYVRCSYEIFDDESGSVLERQVYDEKVLKDLNDVDECYRSWLHGYMWGGIYRRKIWEGFCFPTGFWYEDMVRNLYLYDRCETLASVKDVLYLKRKHRANAADILWKKDDDKCLDQIRLLEALLKMKQEQKIASNRLSDYAAILEMGEYLYKRTEGLDPKKRYDAFLKACDLAEGIRDLPVDKNSDYELYHIQKALKERDYGLYRLIGAYCRYRS